MFIISFLIQNRLQRNTLFFTFANFLCKKAPSRAHWHAICATFSASDVRTQHTNEIKKQKNQLKVWQCGAFAVSLYSDDEADKPKQPLNNPQTTPEHVLWPKQRNPQDARRQHSTDTRHRVIRKRRRPNGSRHVNK